MKYISLEHFIKQKACISEEWVFNFFLLRGIITKLGQSWTLHSLTAQERLLVILYRRKIYSSLEEEWCVVVVSNAYCTNLWGTFLCQNTPSVSLFGTKHLQNKKNLCMLLHYYWGWTFTLRLNRRTRLLAIFYLVGQFFDTYFTRRYG